MHPRRLATIAGLVLAAAARLHPQAQAPSVDAALPAYKPAGPLKGELTIARLEPTEGFIAAWVKDFGRVYPDVKVAQTKEGTRVATDCLDALLDGKVQLAPFVRDVQAPDFANAKKKVGFEPLVLTMAGGSYAMNGNSHALAIYVNAKNPLTRITLPQLDAIYSTTRKRGYPTDLTRWGQLGLTGEWADKPIHPYGMVSRRTEKLVLGKRVQSEVPSIPGVTFAFVDPVMLRGEFKPTVTELPDHPIPGADTALGRKNNTVLADVVRAVADDPYGIGYSGFPELVRQVAELGGEKEYARALPGTKTLAVAETAAGPFSPGTYEDVLTRRYPLSRKIYIIANRPPGQPLDPVVREFLRYALSREGQKAVAEDPQRFLPLPAALAAEERAKLR
jgi:phosphate transport system substrate-binding protein